MTIQCSTIGNKNTTFSHLSGCLRLGGYAPEYVPVILQLEKWMNEMARKASQNSRIGKAIKYTFPLLPRLGRYVNDGRFCIDNNLVENAIRPLALGRKNYLFCGNHDAAIRAAIVYSLVDTCKALDVDPRLWLEDVLLRIPGQ